jgi:hypothetical protein
VGRVAARCAAGAGGGDITAVPSFLSLGAGVAASPARRSVGRAGAFSGASVDARFGTPGSAERDREPGDTGSSGLAMGLSCLVALVGGAVGTSSAAEDSRRAFASELRWGQDQSGVENGEGAAPAAAVAIA